MSKDPQEGAAFAAAIKAAMESPDREVEVIGPDGTPMRIVKGPDPGVRARIEVVAGGSNSGVTIIWDPTEARPARYPKDLPFIPKAAASTSTIMGKRGPLAQVHWFGVADLDGAVNQLVADSLAEGWKHTPVQPSTPEPTRMITLERGDEARTITVRATPGFGMISLLDAGPRSLA